MRVKVRYFAVLRDRRGLAEETLELEGQTARQLADHLIGKHQLDLPSPLIRVAINGVFVADDTDIKDGDTVVLIPPVAGG
ncbi:MAG: MoaD/ThiS family protein [Fimbriimonadaceae bacterium]|nr:MoaD/ThiS family protein [Fimbriimonadaceae bacterium]